MLTKLEINKEIIGHQISYSLLPLRGAALHAIWFIIEKNYGYKSKEQPIVVKYMEICFSVYRVILDRLKWLKFMGEFAC